MASRCAYFVIGQNDSQIYGTQKLVAIFPITVTVNRNEKVRDLKCVHREILFCCDGCSGCLKGMVACCEWIGDSRTCSREVDVLNSK